MVPLTLTLKNFLSYGDSEVTLDFAGMHVVCLSGENGHGKSALLDAITWVLWGETRLGRQGHESLIRIGADEMSVDLTFRVGKDVYRAKRQRSRRTAGANWEIQRSDLAGGWKSLTGTNTADTGRIIQQIVRMSYDTFLNSAYLKQGRADEFVRQTSNRRKEILCEILELSRYDRLEEMAKQRAREAMELATDFERQSNQAQAVAADAERYRAELAAAEEELSKKSTEQAKLHSDLRRAESRKSEISNQIQQRNTLILQQSRAEQQLRELQTEQLKVSENINVLEELLKDRKLIEDDHASLTAAREREQELAPSVQELQAVRIAIPNIRATVEREKQSLENLAERLQRDIKTAQANRDQSGILERRIKEVVDKKAEFDGLEDTLRELRAREDELKDEFAELKSENDRLARLTDEGIERRERLLAQNESCSICGSPLPADKIHELLHQSDETADSLAAQSKVLKQRGSVAKQSLAEIKQQIAQHEQSIKFLSALNDDHIRLQQQYDQAAIASEGLERMVTELHELQVRLQRHGFADEARRQLSELEQQRDSLLQVEAEYAAVQSKIKSLSAVERHYRELITADQKLTSELRIQAITNQQIGTLNEQLSETRAALITFNDVEINLRNAEGELADLIRTEKSFANQLSESQKQIGRLSTSLQLCADAEVRAVAYSGQAAHQKHEENLYKALAGAFGKRGIQASIIESALPELQQYTNDLLDRLTDGDMRVFIETTRLAKTKNVAPVETLEIKISDSIGTRPLEMYSGGEAFRVSFALRIALSMLLVRRAGAELQTLIIDEGFGTQDAKGREKLIDAINAIKQDFDQILVITHIDELKEAFASRIEVYKTSEGSQLRVVQGDAIG